MGTKKKRQARRGRGNPARVSTSSRSHGQARRDSPGLFDLADDLVTAAEGSVRLATKDPTLARFDAAQLVRGINAVKGACLLLEHGHWEFASGVARQLFEQLVNMEYLASQSDRLASATSYAKFGLMQQIAQRLAQARYEADTGRPEDPAFVHLLEGFLRLNFDEFKGTPKKDGSLNLKASWSGRNARQLAETSRNAMRVHQYELLFRVWSTEVHAAPASMMESLFSDQPPADLVRQDVEQSAQLLATVLNLFLDLWHVLANVTQPGLQQDLVWLARIRSELGKVIDLSGYRPPSQA